jgi:hypothetical protein
MSAIGSLKQVQVRDTLDSALPEWPEILERQAALETPVWIEEWLDAGHIQMQQELPESLVETWLEIAERQQPLEPPVWPTEWLDWADNRSASPAAAQNAADSSAAHTVCNFYSAKHPVKDRTGAPRLKQQLAGIAA